MRGPFRRFLLVRQVDVSGVYDSVDDVLTVHGRGGTTHPARR